MQEDSLIELANELIVTDHDAIEAYSAAIAAASSGTLRRQLCVFCDDHRRHVAELSSVVLSLGGVPAARRDFGGLVAKSKVVFGRMAGDTGILAAMRSNETHHLEAYTRAIRVREVPYLLRALLSRNLADEHRHAGWLDVRSQSLSPGWRSDSLQPPACSAC
jgi:uncharacterized protein (TIGR02284 family)